MKQLRAPLLALCTVLALVAASPAQEPPDEKKGGGALVLTNARVAGFDGLVTVLVSGGKVRAVGPQLRAPRATPRLDAGGARVLPGRIDAWAGVAGGDPLGRALDAFDRYDAHAIEEALRNGVTTVFLSPEGGVGVLGLGSVVKLRPGAPADEAVLCEEAAVVVSLGALDASPLARASAWGDLRQRFDGARRYRDALVDYDEALKKWLEEVGATTGAVDSRAGVAPIATPTPTGAPGGAASTAGAPPAPPRRGRPRSPGPPPAPRPQAPAAGKKDDKKPERPKRPGVDRESALLVRVLEGELPLRIRAHRAEDLVAALELGRDLGARVIVEGGIEAHRVADLLAAREARVVLGDPLPPSDARARPPTALPGVAAALAARRIPFALGTGDLSASRFVELSAALAAGQGLERTAAEAAITAGAAELLGLGDRLGKVAPGYDADLVVLAREPLATSPSAEVVIVDGHVVWRRAP